MTPCQLNNRIVAELSNSETCWRFRDAAACCACARQSNLVLRDVESALKSVSLWDFVEWKDFYRLLD